ncbi:phage major capsid protein [Mycobacterium sp. BMJ-28]
MTTLTKEELVAKIDEFAVIATGPEKRSLTDDEFATLTDLEVQLKRANDTDEFLQRHQGYMTPVNHVGVHVAAAKVDDTLERAFGEWVKTGQVNADMTELRAQNEGTPSAGGVLVPATLLDRIEKRIKVFGGVESEAYNYNTDTGGEIRLPRNDDTANRAVVVSELTAPTSGGADLVFDDVVLNAYSLTTSGANNDPIKVSYQVLRDSANLENLITDRISERFGRGLSHYFVNGTGVGEPTGITKNTTIESAFTAAAIDWTELVDAQHDIDTGYWGDAVWIFSSATLAVIRKLEDNQGRPLWTPNAQAGLEGFNAGNLLGHRVVIDNGFAPYADGTANRWGVFGSIKTGFWTRRVNGIRLIRDELTAGAEGGVKFIAHIDADSAVVQPYAYTTLTNS